MLTDEQKLARAVAEAGRQLNKAGFGNLARELVEAHYQRERVDNPTGRAWLTFPCRAEVHADEYASWDANRRRSPLGRLLPHVRR